MEGSGICEVSVLRGFARDNLCRVKGASCGKQICGAE